MATHFNRVHAPFLALLRPVFPPYLLPHSLLLQSQKQFSIGQKLPPVSPKHNSQNTCLSFININSERDMAHVVDWVEALLEYLFIMLIFDLHSSATPSKCSLSFQTINQCICVVVTFTLLWLNI